MAENNQTETIPADAEEATEVTPTRLQKFVLNHPRAAKTLAITTSVIAAAGVALTANTMQKNRNHLRASAALAKDSLAELSTSVSPSTDTEA